MTTQPSDHVLQAVEEISVDDDVDAEDDDGDDDDYAIHVSKDMDWLPPRPRFVPCFPQDVCFSLFCMPFSKQQNVPTKSDQDSTHEVLVSGYLDSVKYPSAELPSAPSSPSQPTRSNVVHEVKDSDAEPTELLTPPIVIVPDNPKPAAEPLQKQRTDSLTALDVPTLTPLCDDEETERSDEGLDHHFHRNSNSVRTSFAATANTGQQILFQLLQLFLSAIVFDQLSKANPFHQNKDKRRLSATSHPPPRTSVMQKESM